MISLKPPVRVPHPFRASLRIPYRPSWQGQAEAVSRFLVGGAFGLTIASVAAAIAKLTGAL